MSPNVKELQCSNSTPKVLCQLSQIIQESPGYKTNLLVSHMGHQISRIKSSYELFCALIWNLSHFLTKFKFFSFIVQCLWHFCMYFITDKAIPKPSPCDKGLDQIVFIRGGGIFGHADIRGS